VYDSTASTGSFVLPGGFTNTEARTIYTVYYNLLDITDSAVPTVITYGANALSDSVANSFITLRQQAWAGDNNFLLARRTGGNGAGIAGSTPGVNVATFGLNGAGNMFITTNNGTVATDSAVVMSLPHERIAFNSPNANSSHVRTLIYRGYHDATTRAAISRYLGNKYGALVA